MTLDLTLFEWLGTLVTGGAISLALGAAGLLLWRRQGSRAANLALGGLLIVAALAVLYVMLIGVQPPGQNLSIVFAPLAYTLAIGPLLYAYVHARLGRGILHWVHAVLPLAQAAVVLTIGLAPLAVKGWWMGNVFSPWWATAQVALTVLSLSGYVVASWREVRAAATPEASGWRLRRDRWLRRLLGGVTLALVVLIAIDGVDALSGTFGVGRAAWISAVERLAYALTLYAAAFAGVVQADVRFESAPLAPPPALAQNAAPLAEPAREPSLVPDVAASHRDALLRLVETERPHLDPDLSLGSLATQIGVTDKTLSALFNETMDTTYTAYVNGLRVEEARQRLADPEQAHYSVLAIGLDAGFASKSTFNRVFKETTGHTPSAYRAAAASE
ncbi:helix-turn-helix domain-containing protein [Rubricoccus marinus]|uniref:HTH araC/xylS-type domain-containing protein n=1 Tax=Rubricoccus marinus TaxID=716817 RepID=A0A259TX38_9BACT|nr:AraC family transcriptional regulator [Rubricoccus marinus]OZC02329.1 hypothetical protein BSZ36_04660 [Rubricoccus marinus]